MKVEERNHLEELNRKLMAREMAFNEKLLQKEELKRLEWEQKVFLQEQQQQQQEQQQQQQQPRDTTTGGYMFYTTHLTNSRSSMPSTSKNWSSLR